MVVPVLLPIGGTRLDSVQAYAILFLLFIALFVLAYFINNSHKYSKEWDEKLKKLLSEKITKRTRVTILIGEYEIWVGNYIYAYGDIHKFKGRNVHIEMFPSLLTRMKLRKKVEEFDKMADEGLFDE